MIPFWVWGFLYWLLFGAFSLRSLLTQLTFGFPVCPPLYFMPVLAMMTFLLFVIWRYCGKVGLVIMMGLAILSLVFQYSGLNYELLLPFGDVTAGCVIGRFVELMPISIGAFVFSACSDKCFRWNLDKILIGVIMIVVGVGLGCIPCVRLLLGFGYQGFVPTVMAIGVCLVAIGIGERFAGDRLSIIRLVGTLSVGVYLVHMMVGRIVFSVYPMGKGAVCACIVFLASILMSLLMLYVPGLKRIVV